MYTKLNILFLLLLSGFTYNLSAQNIISKLEIKAKEVYQVNADNILLVDTLIMHDKAEIRFNSGLPAYIGVNNASIGKNCTISSKGADALQRGKEELSQNGKDAANIDINIHFNKLGSLVIDTRGGSGIKGSNGRGETMATTKSDGDGTYKSIAPTATMLQGGAGGNGGNGGNIVFTYSTDNFIPRFNQVKGPHIIMLVYEGGKGGKPGYYSKIEGTTGTDGKVQLINKNTPYTISQ